jgi:hypothetical protein
LKYETFWKEDLPQKYHIFGGLPVQFDSSNMCVYAKLQPPKVNTSSVFLEEQQYGKRLIGNAFSVPVVEILLRPLQTKFLKREYSDYTYNYVWQEEKKPTPPPVLVPIKQDDQEENKPPPRPVLVPIKQED